MLKIRLQRVGKKHDPSFRVVVTEHTSGPKAGKYVELLGNYDARKDKAPIAVNAERVRYWMSKGAQLSDAVHNLLVSKGVIEGKKRDVLPRKKINDMEKKRNEERTVKEAKEAEEAEDVVAQELPVEEKPTEAVYEKEQPVA